MVLPPAWLQRIVDKQVPFPLTFLVEPQVDKSIRPPSPHNDDDDDDETDNGDIDDSDDEVKRMGESDGDNDDAETTTGSGVYLGVLDFESPSEDMVILPEATMKQLGLSNGDGVVLTSVQLPPGAFVKLQPHDSHWLELEETSRKALLEWELRKHQFLYPGQLLRLSHNQVDYQLRVVECHRANANHNDNDDNGDDSKANEAIAIVDTDLTTEVAPPLVVAEPMPQLAVGETRDFHVAAGELVHFGVAIEDPNTRVVIEARNSEMLQSKGDPDLYVSHTADLCQPSHEAFTWCSDQTPDDTARVELSQDDVYFSAPNTYFVGLRAYPSAGDAVFSVSVTSASKKTRNNGSNNNSDAKTSGASSNAKECSHCGRLIPASSMVMHEMQCRRRQARCPQCNRVMRKEHIDKHVALEHALIECACGVKLEQGPLQVHRRQECRLRLVQCIYCPLRVALEQRGEHQGECGARQATCLHCGAGMQRKQIYRHIERTHGKSRREAKPGVDFH
eukprot:TRINITY_DN39049_c0_g1_i1.p1 TRINITY_DN39049_c0_g1~~TRINITY_DN39049_c0_g1_i1.p1  ORF type:complete len:591 (+),score=266.84 TRINITY_DN39049_c0_g1_i1:260-1774(+)